MENKARYSFHSSLKQKGVASPRFRSYLRLRRFYAIIYLRCCLNPNDEGFGCYFEKLSKYLKDMKLI